MGGLSTSAKPSGSGHIFASPPSSLILQQQQQQQKASRETSASPVTIWKTGRTTDTKTYTQTVPPGSTDAEANVTLYYWNETDGVEFSGWWFGNEPEGQRVRLRYPSPSLTPPPTGWLVPWNGVAIPGILSVKRPMSVILLDDPDDGGRSWDEVARSCAWM